MGKRKKKSSRYYRVYSESNNYNSSSNNDDSKFSESISDDLKKLIDDIKGKLSDKSGSSSHHKSFNLKKWYKKSLKNDKLNSIFAVLGIMAVVLLISKIGIPIVMVILFGVLIYVILCG